MQIKKNSLIYRGKWCLLRHLNTKAAPIVRINHIKTPIVLCVCVCVWFSWWKMCADADKLANKFVIFRRTCHAGNNSVFVNVVSLCVFFPGQNT